MENSEITGNANSSMEDTILKSLSKAELNGFTFKASLIKRIEFIGFGKINVEFLTDALEEDAIFTFHINDLFFNHNFAKAFFGDQEVCAKCGKTLKKTDWDSNSCSSCGHNIEEQEYGYIENWAFHLKRMVISTNIIEYLDGFLKQ